LDIRNPGKWLRKPLPKAFTTALDENPGLWCEIKQLLAAKPPFRSIQLESEVRILFQYIFFALAFVYTTPYS
jgi:hypothetical protein